MGNAASSDSPEVANCVAELEKLKDTSHVVNKENGTSEVNHLAKMVLACTLEEFLALFWEDEAQHVRFLENEIKETNISITPFVRVPGVEGGGDVSKVQMQRTVSVHHPLPIQLPWLPLVIQNACLQTISFDRATGEVRIYERSCVSAIPFCEPIVTAAWLLTEREGALECEVTLAWECEGAPRPLSTLFSPPPLCFLLSSCPLLAAPFLTTPHIPHTHTPYTLPPLPFLPIHPP